MIMKYCVHRVYRPTYIYINRKHLFPWIMYMYIICLIFVGVHSIHYHASFVALILMVFAFSLHVNQHVEQFVHSCTSVATWKISLVADYMLQSIMRQQYSSGVIKSPLWYETFPVVFIKSSFWGLWSIKINYKTHFCRHVIQ